MIELIISLWPILVAAGAFIGVFVWGQKKKAAGRAQERERAKDAQIAAHRDAVRTRDSAAAKPIDQQRRDVERWEQ